MTDFIPPTEENVALAEAMELSERIPSGTLRSAILENLDLIAKAQILRRQKLKHDKRARKLVGAMISRVDAVRYARIAKATGRSMTRYCMDALETEYAKLMDEWTRDGGRETGETVE